MRFVYFFFVWNPELRCCDELLISQRFFVFEYSGSINKLSTPIKRIMRIDVSYVFFVYIEKRSGAILHEVFENVRILSHFCINDLSMPVDKIVDIKGKNIIF